ncbi:MAG TPA: inorganic phosphate transporter [Bacteroidales bacterium]|nr:inorganic phosphate transporter [Bacteroidales bacterium]
MFGLDAGMTILLIISILTACLFEFINGFHDTSNAVVNVIYTRSMKPSAAVIWSAIMNFAGVLFGGIVVAMGIMKLLPNELLMNQTLAQNVALIFAILLSSIIWNFGTWYLGIPSSSSHTLLGSIFGVGVAYNFLPEASSIALNWGKVESVCIWLLLSPLVGFMLAWGLVALLKKTVKYKKFYRAPHAKKAPPFWIRLIIILSGTHLSFSHGQNDGQKGVGIIMIILIAIVPAHFAINHHHHPEKLLLQVNSIENVINKLDSQPLNVKDKAALSVIHYRIDTMQSVLAGKPSFDSISAASSWVLRDNIMHLEGETNAILEVIPGKQVVSLTRDDKKLLESEFEGIKSYTDYAPVWIIFMISLALGLGTTIGWKRIVVTVGEKIGKEPLNYAQGASANLIAASTISLSSVFGLPVSTTQILSSGIAGSMVATNGIKNVRKKTLKNILITWLLTIPVTMILAGLLFLLFRSIF